MRIVVMGVSGSGKSTVGAGLAARLGVPFREGDDLHPPRNVALMRAGVPLTDADRWPWLEQVRDWLAARQGGAVVSCSALRRSYRDLLRGAGDVVVVHLDVDRGLLADRLAARTGHFMAATLLSSQLATLEPPGPDERAVTVPVGAGAPDEVLDRVAAAVATLRADPS